MTEATDELRILSRALSAHAKELHAAADRARERSAVLKEMSRILKDSSQVRRVQAAALKRHRQYHKPDRQSD